MRDALLQSGCQGIPTSHNLPLGDGASVLDPGRLEAAVDLIGIDYYHRASPAQRTVIARRTTELAARCVAGERPTFACELGTGFPPYIPPLSSRDCLFTALTALAYGLRGFNLYIAVDRDLWIGAPLDRRGRRRPQAGDWERLLTALNRIGFAELERSVEVAVVVPRSHRRLARVLNAFGAVPPAVFDLSGGGAVDSCFEDEWKEDGPVVVEVARFVERLEGALESRRIPFELVSGDVFERAPARRPWSVVACGGALEESLRETVQSAWDSLVPLTIGPRPVTRDAQMRPLNATLEVPEGLPVPPYVAANSGLIGELLDVARERLALGTLQAEPAEISVELHRRKTGEPAALFIINPSDHDVNASVSAAGAEVATDALDGQDYSARLGRLELRLLARSVRMLELR
jgi:beta-galactosidase